MSSLLSQIQEKGVIPSSLIEEELRTQGNEQAVIDALLQKGLISPEELANIRVQSYGLPLLGVEEGFRVPIELLKIFSQDTIKRLKILPLHREGNEVTVGIVEPENIEVDSALGFIAVSQNITIKRGIITLSHFEMVVERLSGLESEVKEALQRFGEEKKEKMEKAEKIVSQVELQRLTEAQPITRIVDVILRYGIDAEASDIHIEPTQNAVRIRFRIDGKLNASLSLPKETRSAIISRVKILANLRVDETRMPQDGRIHYFSGADVIDFRVATFPTIEGEKAALRILDSRKGLFPLEELGLQPKSLEDVRLFMKRPFGALLISGPTGSGKTTTLYSVLKELNREDTNIVTLEDPVEYYLGGISQSQVHPEIGYDFASGLREILRQDPNVVMVGEVRDNETASLLIQASLTGHLVLSTIHTNDAIGIIPRLLDMGVDNFLIPSAVRLVVAQRLIPKLCQDCKELYSPPSHIQSVIEREIGLFPADALNEIFQPDKGEEVSKRILEAISKKQFNHLVFYKSRGCQYCGEKGIKGRVAVYETMIVGQELEKVIIESVSEAALKKEAQRQGMITMRQDGIIKALQGVVGIEGVITNTAPSYT